MRLTFEKFDGRSFGYTDIIDHETGNIVGYIRAAGSGDGGIVVSLFDDKYRTEVNRYDECRGFVLGVEAVLNHLQNHLTAGGYPPKKKSNVA